MVSVEIPSNDDWRGKGLEEVQIQSRSRWGSIEVDQSESAAIEPETNGKDFQVGSGRRGNVLLLHRVSAKDQSEETAAKTVSICAKELVSKGADGRELYGGLKVRFLDECNLDLIGDEELQEFRQL